MQGAYRLQQKALACASEKVAASPTKPQPQPPQDVAAKPAASPAHPKSNQKIFLLPLPPEIRLMIYKYRWANTKASLDINTIEFRRAALLLTCKKAYNEALKPYYQNCIFTTRNYAIMDLSLWIAFIPDYIREWVKHIRLEHDYRGIFMSERSDLGYVRGFLKDKYAIDFPDGVLHEVIFGADGDEVLLYT